MKRLLLSLASTLALSSCGLYTNVPAQFHVGEIKPASLTYQKADSDGYREIKIEPAEITLIAEPGSIGVRFDKMVIQYYGPDNKLVGTDLPTLNTYLTTHLQSSNYPSDPAGGVIDTSKIGQAVYVGKMTTALPIVTRLVEDYGMKAAAYSPAVTAEVLWSGEDDAGFPVDLRFHVPIVFHGAPGAGK